ncbi:cytochrome-c oxidase, cbb3-type subunit III [Methylobacillus flagellatus]|uniref:cytochrome-c oxidase, cbb3-type subunit III n=1 Tax=Methylobacillus flagellatus TaxID=405 RepID=UPI0010F898CA|nr:cytochrome-c oxidase, cbb3-type subunit III [Methylobacillus flagellatus]
MSQDNNTNTTKTTGHVWDNDLQELDNPLPRWWIWGFYITFLFTIVYWLFYPAWPIGNNYTKGVPGLNSITYTATQPNGEQVEKTTHWNMRSKFMVEMNELQEAQKKWFDKVAAMPFEDVQKDAELMQFVNSVGKTMFTDNCAPCHQQGAQGKIGFSPNLADDHWQYGGTYQNIEETIVAGRNGYMPPFKEVLQDEQITQLANYVLEMSGEPHDAEASKAGAALFRSETAACFYCHGENAQGKIQMGSANLTDKIWLWADIPGSKTDAAKLAEVKRVITGGLNRGVMPAWSGRLSPAQIKLLTVYVHDSLGGGK